MYIYIYIPSSSDAGRAVGCRFDGGCGFNLTSDEIVNTLGALRVESEASFALPIKPKTKETASLVTPGLAMLPLGVTEEPPLPPRS